MYFTYFILCDSRLCTYGLVHNARELCNVMLYFFREDFSKLYYFNEISQLSVYCILNCYICVTVARISASF